MRRHGQLVERVPQPVKDDRQHSCHQTARDPQCRIPGETHEVRRSQTFRHPEKRLPSDDETVESVGHYRTEHGVEQRAGFELHVGIQNFDREDRGPDRGAEDRRQARCNANQNQEPPVVVRALQHRRVD